MATVAVPFVAAATELKNPEEEEQPREPRVETVPKSNKTKNRHPRIPQSKSLPSTPRSDKETTSKSSILTTSTRSLPDNKEVDPSEIDVENIQGQEVKKTLRKHLGNRPKREELISRHILKAFNTDPGLQRVMTNLLRQRVKTLLNQNLSQRKSIQSLIRSNILQAPSDNAGNEMFRRMSDHDLTQFLAQRISLEELQRANVVEDVLTWIQIPTTGTIPRARNCHTANILKNKDAQDEMFVLGGFGTGSASLELLRLNLFSFVWSRPLVGGVVPSERYSHTTCVIGKHLLVFGGFNVDGSWLNDLHALDTEHSSEFVPSLGAFGVNKSKTSPLLLWYQPECTGDPPEARAAHAACVVGTKMYVFGGNNGSKLYNDLHVLNLTSMEWTQPSTLGDPPCPRAGHSMTLCMQTLVVIFGGSDGNKPLNDIHYFDTETCTWSTPKVVGTPPSPRAGHTAVAYGKNKMLVFAGGYHTQIYNDLYMYDIDTCSWARPSDTGLVPQPRAGHSCVVASDSNTLYVFAGGDVDRELWNDFYTLDPGYIKTSEDAIASDLVLKKSRADGADVDDAKSVSTASETTHTTNSTSIFDGDISHEFRKSHDMISDMIGAVTKNVNDKLAHFRTREHQLFQILKAIESERDSLVSDMRTELQDLQVNIAAHLGKLEQRVHRYFLHASIRDRDSSFSSTTQTQRSPNKSLSPTTSLTMPNFVNAPLSTATTASSISTATVPSSTPPTFHPHLSFNRPPGVPLIMPSFAPQAGVGVAPNAAIPMPFGPLNLGRFPGAASATSPPVPIPNFSMPAATPLNGQPGLGMNFGVVGDGTGLANVGMAHQPPYLGIHGRGHRSAPPGYHLASSPVSSVGSASVGVAMGMNDAGGNGGKRKFKARRRNRRKKEKQNQHQRHPTENHPGNS